jgi:hypothetical protein
MEEGREKRDTPTKSTATSTRLTTQRYIQKPRKHKLKNKTQE